MTGYDAASRALALVPEPDPLEAVDIIKKAAAETDADARAVAVAAAVAKLATESMSAQTTVIVRAHLLREKLLTAKAFDLIVKEARTRQCSALGPGVGKSVHTFTPRPDLASDQDILARLVVSLRDHSGLTGEHRNAKLAYLAITSRHLGKPVSFVVKGLSSSGKSYTIECVTLAFDPDGLIVMSGMSEHALVYWPGDFAHKTIILYEATALQEVRERQDGHQGAMFLRTLISEGRLSYPTVGKDESGNLVTRVIEKDGPTNVIMTTTSVSLHHENETRMLSLYSDDSAEQTSRILGAIAEDKSRGGHGYAEWHELDRWISQARHEVVIPYAHWLARQIPPVAVRLRRDFATFLSLVKAHAILHQANRDIDGDDRIIATETDYLAVRELVCDLLADQISATVKATTRETVTAVGALCGANPAGVTVKQLADHLNIERSAAQYRVKAARDGGYIVNNEDRRNKQALYVPGEPLPEGKPVLPERLGGDDGEFTVNAPKPHLQNVNAQVSGGADAGCEGVNAFPTPRGEGDTLPSPEGPAGSFGGFGGYEWTDDPAETASPAQPRVGRYHEDACPGDHEFYGPGGRPCRAALR